MKNQSYNTTILVDQTPQEAFTAINNAHGRWSGEINGETNKLGDEFTYNAPEMHWCKMKITEFVPGKKSSATCWIAISPIQKPKPSGMIPILRSKSRRRMAKPRSTSRILA